MSDLAEGTIIVAAVWPCSVDPWADRRSCPWLEIHSCWKGTMKPAAKALQEILCDFVLPRYCMVCKRDFPKGYGKHLLEVHHWECLRQQLPEGRHIVAASMSFWQRWQLAGNFLRFNHINGQVEVSGWEKTRPKLLMRREVLPPSKTSKLRSSALRRSTSLTLLTGLPSPSTLDSGDVFFKEHLGTGHTRRHQVDWEMYPYLEPDTEPDQLQIESFAWRLWLEYVATDSALTAVHRFFNPGRCAICDAKFSSSFAEHLCSRRHFSALFHAVSTMAPKMTTHPTQSMESQEGQVLDLDHLQLLLSRRKLLSGGALRMEEPPLMLGVTEIEEFAWRLWRQYVATVDATEDVQRLLIQHQVFQESLVCAVCRETLPCREVGQHLRSPGHFRKLLWWLFQANLLSRADLFRPNTRLLRQNFRAFDSSLKLNHLQMLITRVTGTPKDGGVIFEISTKAASPCKCLMLNWEQCPKMEVQLTPQFR
ncbi:unnamed protein product [Cladocopium goreaui]|uniref:Uncharacterized protein n=1 Tax=Cladocopium goreaui TaxID=2562237 RepID=A0A9P1C8U2_9DINO|nr:unnamed protein product [Cladocopium goreaui]